MFTKLLTLSVLSVSAYCLSIGTVSEKNNVTKRETNAGDLFPDWVPFKNKHGDQLGEFVQVQKKSKLKKRLAPPINFQLRAVAEPQDEYYDKGAGDSDSEDNYENKDWSDLHRPAEAADKQKVSINHTDLSDIDGVVDILIKKTPDPVVEALLNSKKTHETETREINEKQIEEPVTLKKETSITETSTTEIVVAVATPKPESKSEGKKYEKKDNDEESEEYEEPKKVDKSEEQKEEEEKKRKILSGVDELKERHAEEQRELSQKIKNEDLFKGEFEKDQSSDESPEKFLAKYTEEPSTERPRKYRRKSTAAPDYDEYEDANKPIENKYEINVLKTTTSTESPRTMSRKTTTAARAKYIPNKEKHIESGKLSVFKNPHLFMLYDESDEQTTKPKPRMPSDNSQRGPKKFSSKYTTNIPDNSNERISLVPADSKEGEPTLFFPKPRKNKRKKVKTTTPAYDSTVAETVTDHYKQTTAYGVTAPASTGNNSLEVTATGTGPDGTETLKIQDTDTTGTASITVRTEPVPARTSPVTDAVPAPSDHKKEHPKEEDYHREKGGERDHHSEHSEEHEEHGKKAYEGHHEDTKTAKGHHDKEDHLGKYDDHGGIEKHHSEESGHYGDHHHEEHGKKHAKYEESGKHSKGHNTKGSHDIHKKEEYEKKVEFFEEEGDSSEEEKHGGFGESKEHSEGGKFSHGKHNAGHHHGHKGEAGHFAKGGHSHGEKGHKHSGGHDHHGKAGQKHFQKEGKDSGRKWIYHHGHPAKTANLVVIDRRGFDQFYHGPHYYG